MKSRRGAAHGNWIRWLKFNAVGAAGIGVQLAVLVSLRAGLHLHYLLATALAVEATVLHNFFWHKRFTWADRKSTNWGAPAEIQPRHGTLLNCRQSVFYRAAGASRPRLSSRQCGIDRAVLADQFLFE